jgi:CBS domain-containing protein
MQIREVMSQNPEVININSSISDAARRMRDLNCGLMPVYSEDKLVGMVTDRDLAIRALTNGISGVDSLSSIITEKVLYCYEDDEVTDVLENMEQNRVQRLIVLDDENEKNLVGVVSVADIADQCRDEDSMRAVVHCCRHYHW